MQILAIDIETTGMNPDTNQIIEVGLVFFNTFTKERNAVSWMIAHETYVGDAFALAMNQRIFNELKNPTESKEFIISYKFLAEYIEIFLKDVPLPVVLAGKNVAGFDLQFFSRIPGFKSGWFHHRVLDIGSLYLYPGIDDVLPSLEECKKRAGLSTNVSHKALDDANDVIDLIIAYYNL